MTNIITTIALIKIVPLQTWLTDEPVLFIAALLILALIITLLAAFKKKLPRQLPGVNYENNILRKKISHLKEKLKQSEKTLLSMAPEGKENKKNNNYTGTYQQTNIQLRELSARIQKAREEERRRIAREIHDELGQQLTALKFDLSWIRKRLNPEQEEITNKVKQALTLIDQTVHTVRKISSDLRPGVLDDLGLLPALEWQCMDFERRTGIRCNFKTSLPEVEFNMDFSVNVFRILQETLTNIARHSGATKVRINLSLEKDIFVMEISDNGTGITENEINSNKSFGLIGIKERIYMYGGDLSIIGTQEDGTTVKVKIPLPKQGKSLWPEENETRN